MNFVDVWLTAEGIPRKSLVRFSGDVNYIEAAYYAGLPKRLNLRRDRVFRFVVNACPKKRTPPYGRFENNGEVVEIFRAFDFAKYWKLSDPVARKNVALDFMQKGVEAICKRLAVNPRPFRKAYRSVKAGPAFYCYAATKAQYNPNRSLRAYLEVKYIPGIGSIFAVFEDVRSKLSKRVRVWKGIPSYVVVSSLIGKTRWRGQNILVILPRLRGKALVARAPRFDS